MIPIPPHAVRGQVLTADFLNRILDALRATRPIQGPGILLRETPHGVVIEATAKAAKGAAAGSPGKVTHQPFELRVREGEGGPFLDVYAPQGAAVRFLDERGKTETLESAWNPSLAEAPGKGGWHTFGKLADLPFGAQTNTCWVALDLTLEDAFALSASESAPSAAGYEGSVTIGTVSRTGKGTKEEPYAYGTTQRVAGAFRREYAWLGAEGLFVEAGGQLSDDLDAVAWTRETKAWLCRLYGLVATFPIGGQAVLENPCAEIPKGSQDGKPVTASKLAARAHAADHIEDFIPFTEAKP